MSDSTYYLIEVGSLFLFTATMATYATQEHGLHTENHLVQAGPELDCNVHLSIRGQPFMVGTEGRWYYVPICVLVVKLSCA